MTGRGVPRDEKEAMCYMKLSAGQGNKWAQMQVGKRLCREGALEWVAMEGLKYLKRSADQGYAPAQRLYWKHVLRHQLFKDDDVLPFYNFVVGEDSTEAECKEICKKYSGGQEQIDFDSYVKFMLDRFKNEDSAAAASEAFNAICQNSGIVTEEHLARYFSPEDAAFLRANLQPADGGYRYEEWISSIYA